MHYVVFSCYCFQLVYLLGLRWGWGVSNCFRNMVDILIIRVLLAFPPHDWKLWPFRFNTIWNKITHSLNWHQNEINKGDKSVFWNHRIIRKIRGIYIRPIRYIPFVRKYLGTYTCICCNWASVSFKHSVFSLKTWRYKKRGRRDPSFRL